MEDNSRQYHIRCGRGETGKYCLLPGDPGRCESVSRYFDHPELIASNREFVTYTGTYLGEPVSVVSTGIGGPSAAIAIEELSALGAHTFIRIGTCGGISAKVKAGDLVIATGAVRQEGTSLHYAPVEYPAVSDFDVASALIDSAAKLGVSCHVGVVQSKDSFYGQHSPDRMPVSYELKQKWLAWKRLGVLASEMETAALFVTANALGVRCGSVLQAVWNQELDPPAELKKRDDNTALLETAVHALRMLVHGSV